MPPKRAVGLAKTNKLKKAHDPEPKRRRTDGGEELEVHPELVQVTSEDWGDLKELYARSKDAADEGDVQFGDHIIACSTCSSRAIPEGPAKALHLFRGVLHECDRIIRNFPDPSQIIIEEASTLANTFDPYSLPSSFHSLYANAILDIGTVIGKDPDFSIEGEPDALEDYLNAAFEILGASAAQHQTTDKHDWAHNFAWMKGLLLLADIRGGEKSEIHRSTSLEKQNIMDLSGAELVEKAQKHFQTCSYLLSEHQERNEEGEARYLLEYPSFPAFLSIYTHLLLNVVEGIDSPEEQTKKAEQIRAILDLATQSLMENSDVKQRLCVESDIKMCMALIGRIQAEASISSVDDEDLNNPLVITARADLKECKSPIYDELSLRANYAAL